MRVPEILVREATGCGIIEAKAALLRVGGSVEEAIKLCKDTPGMHTRSCPRSLLAREDSDKCTCRSHK